MVQGQKGIEGGRVVATPPLAMGYGTGCHGHHFEFAMNSKFANICKILFATAVKYDTIIHFTAFGSVFYVFFSFFHHKS